MTWIVKNGHRYGKCEVCSEERKQHGLNNQNGHLICKLCFRFPSRWNAELTANSFKVLKDEENKSLWRDLKRQGLSDQEASKRINNLKRRISFNNRFRNKTKYKPEFKTAFQLLTERGKKDAT